MILLLFPDRNGINHFRYFVCAGNVLGRGRLFAFDLNDGDRRVSITPVRSFSSFSGTLNLFDAPLKVVRDSTESGHSMVAFSIDTKLSRQYQFVNIVSKRYYFVYGPLET